jgi:hypothetical protein
MSFRITHSRIHSLTYRPAYCPVVSITARRRCRVPYHDVPSIFPCLVSLLIASTSYWGKIPGMGDGTSMPACSACAARNICVRVDSEKDSDQAQDRLRCSRPCLPVCASCLWPALGAFLSGHTRCGCGRVWLTTLQQTGSTYRDQAQSRDGIVNGLDRNALGSHIQQRHVAGEQCVVLCYR